MAAAASYQPSAWQRENDVAKAWQHGGVSAAWRKQRKQ